MACGFHTINYEFSISSKKLNVVLLLLGDSMVFLIIVNVVVYFTIFKKRFNENIIIFISFIVTNTSEVITVTSHGRYTPHRSVV